MIVTGSPHGLHFPFYLFIFFKKEKTSLLQKNKAASPESSSTSAGCPSQGSILPGLTVRQVSELQ